MALADDLVHHARCGCDSGWWNMPCRCVSAGVVSACPSWGPVDGCSCLEHFGKVGHGEPPSKDAA